MNEEMLLLIYKSLRLPVLVIALSFITWYVYSKKRKEEMEAPKYNMLKED